MGKIRCLFLISLGVFSALGISQESGMLILDETPLPIGTLIEAITAIIQNWKGLSGIAVYSSIVSLLTLSLRTEPLFSIINRLGIKGPWIRRLSVLVFSQISGILLSIQAGGGLWDAILSGLIVQGGAVALYEHLKPFFVKK